MDKQVVVYPYIGIQLSNKKNVWWAWMCMDESKQHDESQNKYVEWKKPDKRGYSVYNSISIKL